MVYKFSYSSQKIEKNENWWYHPTAQLVDGTVTSHFAHFNSTCLRKFKIIQLTVTAEQERILAPIKLIKASTQ